MQYLQRKADIVLSPAAIFHSLRRRREPLVVTEIVEIAHLVAHVLRDRGIKLRFSVIWKNSLIGCVGRVRMPSGASSVKFSISRLWSTR